MKTLFVKLKEAVEAFIEYIREYNKRVAEIEADTRLSQLAKAEKISDEEENRSGRIEALKALISERVKALLEAVNDAAVSCEFDYELLTSRINLIKTLDGNITEEVKKDIISTFEGNSQALTLLKGVFMSYGVNCDEIDRLTNCPEAIEAKTQQIENAVFFMSHDGKSYAHFGELTKLVDELEDMLYFEDKEKI